MTLLVAFPVPQQPQPACLNEPPGAIAARRQHFAEDTHVASRGDIEAEGVIAHVAGILGRLLAADLSKMSNVDMHGPTCAHLHKAHEGEQGIIANPASLAAAGYVVLSGVNLACERLQRVQHVARRRFAGHGGRLFGRVGPEHAAAVFLFRPPHGLVGACAIGRRTDLFRPK